MENKQSISDRFDDIAGSILEQRELAKAAIFVYENAGNEGLGALLHTIERNLSKSLTNLFNEMSNLPNSKAINPTSSSLKDGNDG